MIIDWVLLALRLLAPAILYAFLGTMVYHVLTTASARISARLVAVDDAARRWQLSPETTLGRDAANTIPVDDEFVSARHARVFLRDGGWWLADMGSTNGTTRNGTPISAPVPLKPGDIIGVGNHFFRLELQE